MGKPSVEGPGGKIHPLSTFMEHKAAVETVEVYTVPVPAKKANAIVNAFREVLPPQNRSGLDLQHLRRLVREEFLSKQVLARMKATAAENALAVKFDTECAILDADGDHAQDACVILGPKSRTSSTGSNNSYRSQRNVSVLTTRKPSDPNANITVSGPGEEQKEPTQKKRPRRRSSAEKRAAKREREKAALQRLQALEANGGVLDCSVFASISSSYNSQPTSPIESTSLVNTLDNPSKENDVPSNIGINTKLAITTCPTTVSNLQGEELTLIDAQDLTDTHTSAEATSQPNEDPIPELDQQTEAGVSTNGNTQNDTLGENTPPTAAGRAPRKRRRRSSGNKKRARSGSSVSGSTDASTGTPEISQDSAPSNSPSKAPSPAKKPVKQNLLHLLIAPISAIELTTVYNILRPLLFPTFPEVSTIEVPLHASISQDQADEWSALYWPAIYKRGNPFGPHPPYVEQTINKTAPKIPEYMALVREAAKQAYDSGHGLKVGALVVDPSNEEVVAVAGDGRNMTFGGDEKVRDCTWGNPLEHAIMRAVGMVAAKRKLREDLEIGTKIDIEEGIKMMEARETTLRHIPSTEIEKKYFYSINKKQQADSAIITTDNSVTASNTGEDTVNLDTEKKGKETGEYLCHNHIVYVTHEPCVMCSMALIHSRIGMVVIDGKNKASHPGWGGIYVGGSPFYRPVEERRRQLRRKQKRAIGSSDSEAEKSSDNGVEAGYGLFWRKELNWKFLAFEWIEGDGAPREEINGHEFYP